MAKAATDTFLCQTWMENSEFYINQDEYDNTYTVLNKMLLSFGAYLYQYGQKWIIERIENVSRVGDWVYYVHDSTSGVGIATLKQSLNKQAGDFKYCDESQILQYNSGIKTLKLNLLDKELNTLVPNNYDADTVTTITDETPEAGSLSTKTFYTNINNTALDSGLVYGEMSHYFYWQAGPLPAWQYRGGLYYVFSVQFNASTKPTSLQVNYKTELLTTSGVGIVQMRFFIRVNSGTKAGYYLARAETGDLYCREEDSVIPPYVFVKEFSGDAVLNSMSVSEILDLKSIWTELGSPAIQDFIIGFLPAYIQLSGDESWVYLTPNCIGDFEIKIDPEKQNNSITTIINDNFIKKEENEIDLFDLNNINYSNGLEYTSAGAKTSAWSTTGGAPYTSLVNLFIKDRFRKYSATARNIAAKILYDGYIKPFALLTDNDLVGLTFVISKYNWDLVNGTYEIEAEEYPKVGSNS
jgi:hypothetical protein